MSIEKALIQRTQKEARHNLLKLIKSGNVCVREINKLPHIEISDSISYFIIRLDYPYVNGTKYVGTFEIWGGNEISVELSQEEYSSFINLASCFEECKKVMK